MVVDGDSIFFVLFDLVFVVCNLVDDWFVCKSIDVVGGLIVFG